LGGFRGGGGGNRDDKVGETFPGSRNREKSGSRRNGKITQPCVTISQLRRSKEAKPDKKRVEASIKETGSGRSAPPPPPPPSAGPSPLRGD